MRKEYNLKTGAKSQGFALFMALVFLLVMTTLGITMMNYSTLEYRMSVNTAFHEQAFQAAEGGRKAMTSILDEHIFERGWAGVSLPSGMTINDNNNDSRPDNLFITSTTNSTEDLQQPTTLIEDASYSKASIKASISVISVGALANSGSGQEMFRGYDGLGQGSGSGGSARFFEVRSKGASNGNSTATIASHYRVILR